MCDLCFTTIFNKEFYVFPCLHAFHRECIWNFMKDYKPKDVKVLALTREIKSYYGQIDAVRARA